MFGLYILLCSVEYRRRVWSVYSTVCSVVYRRRVWSVFWFSLSSVPDTTDRILNHASTQTSFFRFFIFLAIIQGDKTYLSYQTQFKISRSKGFGGQGIEFFATNSDFLISISLQPNVVDL